MKWIFKQFFDWMKRRSGVVFFDWDRGPGYYSLPRIGEISKQKMKSGRVAIYRFVGAGFYRDPPDMIQHAYYQLLGFVGEKLISDMSFWEYLAFVKREKLILSGNAEAPK